MTSRETRDESVLVRRMHGARVRQWAIAAISVSLTALGVCLLSPAEIGAFAYYSLLALMLLNATVALRQSALVIFPIEMLLRKVRGIERDIEEGRFPTRRFSIHSDDAFACLAAGLDNLVASIEEKLRVANQRAESGAAMIQATPFTIFTVSDKGKIYAVIKDHYDLVPLLGLEVGQGPSGEKWGRENADRYLKEIAKSFSSGETRWFDFDIGAHHLRGCVKRISDLTALVEIGDLPSIDKTVSDMTGTVNESGFSHRQNTLKRFAASLAHDGKNVFAALSNLVALNRNSTDPNVREQVPLAEEAIRRGTNLMLELTSYAGETRYHLVCVPAAQGLRKIIESPMVTSLVPRGVEYITHVSDQPMPEIDIDEDQMWKVMCNLVKNAAEAMVGGGKRIWIDVAPCTLSEESARSFRHIGSLRTGSGVLVTVTDDGPGITQSMMDRLFDPYSSNKGEGRGIGLPTVLTIVGAHGGAVSVKSSPGYGTTFFVFLPASRNTSEEVRLIREVAPNGEILLLDDDPTILHTTSLVLKTLKIAAHPASNEVDALAKVRTLRSRLRAVLVDANIRCASSACFVQTVHDEFPKLPVIVISGSPKATVSSQFAGVAFDGFLSKPYSVDDLERALVSVAPVS